MTKLLFEVMIKSGLDGKTNIFCITSITTENEISYEFPSELQPVELHKEFVKTEIFTKVKNSLKKRHQKRNVWVNLTPELKKTYIDESGNMCFQDYLLEAKEKQLSEPKNSEALTEILKQLLVKKEQNIPNLKKLSEKFTIEKYTSKNPNAKQWLELFEQECERFDLSEDKLKIETLRHFLDKNGLDWYSSMMIKETINSDWLIWKTKFCETYANKGWNAITYAMTFKYLEGSLVDYAVKKERLLLEVRKSMDTGTVIDLIAIGLPRYILNKIERENLKSQEDLFTELSKHEYLTKKSNVETKKEINTMHTKKSDQKQPCKTCSKLNKGTRYHTEETCWFKSKQGEKDTRELSKQVNNTILEINSYSDEEKNE